MAEQNYDITIKDRENPESLINKLPLIMAEKLAVVPNDILELSESELRQKIKPDVALERLRHSLWIEVERAQRTKTPMIMSNIYEGYCSREHFQRNVITNSFKFAYLCTPPGSLETIAVENLYLAHEQIRNILETPHIDDKGKINVAHAKLKLDTWKELNNRVRGMAVQRIEQKNLHLHKDLPTEESPKDINEINARIKELEGSGADVPLEVTYEEKT